MEVGRSNIPIKAHLVLRVKGHLPRSNETVGIAMADVCEEVGTFYTLFARKSPLFCPHRAEWMGRRMDQRSLFPNPPQWMASPFPRRSQCLRPPRKGLLPPLTLARPWLKAVREVGETVAMTATRKRGNTTPQALMAEERKVSHTQALLHASRRISLPPSIPSSLLSLCLRVQPSRGDDRGEDSAGGRWRGWDQVPHPPSPLPGPSP